MFLTAVGYNPEMGGAFRLRADLLIRVLKIRCMGSGGSPKPAVDGDVDYKDVGLIHFFSRISHPVLSSWCCRSSLPKAYFYDVGLS